MQRFKGVNGEILPNTQMLDWLRVEHALQRFRNVWAPIKTYPFLAVYTARVEALCTGSMLAETIDTRRI